MRIRYFRVAFLTLFIFTLSCQNDSDLKIEYSNIETNTFVTNTISLEEIPEIGLYLESKSKKELFSKSSKSNGGPIFDIETINKVIDTLGNENYSFSFFFPDSKSNEMYNLIVGRDSIGQKTVPVIFKYTCNSEDMENWVTNNYDFGHFKGSVDMHKFTDFFDDSTFSKSDCPPEHDDNGDPIPCIRDNVGTGGSGGSGTGGGTGGGTSGGCEYNSYWSACGGSNQYTTHGSESCGGNGNGSGWVIEVDCPNGNDSTTYLFKNSSASNCPGCDSGPSGGVSINTLARPVRKLQYYLEGALSDEELLWLSNHEIEAKRLVDFFLTEGRSDETRAIAIRALLTMTTGDYVVSISPLVRYPLGSNYASNYPKLTEYLKNQLPKVADIPKITNAIHEFTELPLDKIKDDLKWGEGPIIEIIQLDNYPDCSTCNDDTVGFFDEEKANRIFIDIDYVNQIENGNVIETDDDAFIFFIGTAILHEYVHYGENSNPDFFYWGEEGVKFEMRVYDTNVTPYNARLVLDRNK